MILTKRYGENIHITGVELQKEIYDCNELLKTHDKIVIAIGGHSGYKLLEQFGIKIVKPKPSLTGLNTAENFKELSGTVVKDAAIDGLCGDILFTHFGISGPLVYTVSSINAFKNMPYKLAIDLNPDLMDLQEILNTSPHKEIKNILSDFMPKKLAEFVLTDFDKNAKAHSIDGRTRDLILEKIHRFEVTVEGTNKGEEIVTAGGVDLDEINPKTMEVKKVPNLYCIGEVLNIDGFCGGFNLQNAWSTSYICAKGITKDLSG